MAIEIQPPTRSHMEQPIGTIRLRRKGKALTPYIKIRADGNDHRDNWIPWARWWWLNNRGPVPAGHRIVLLDGNPWNLTGVNVGAVKPGDVFCIAAKKDPTMWDRNRKAASEGTARFNRETGKRNRAKIWLPTQWYAVFPDRSAVLNLPRRSRRGTLLLFGLSISRNGRIPIVLPFELMRGGEITRKFPDFRRLSRPPADARADILPPKRPAVVPNPGGLCQCGCGQVTPVAKFDSPDVSLGQYRRFVQGHYSNWIRKNVRADWGRAGRDLCLRIALEVASAASEARKDEVLGPAFEAAMNCHSRRSRRIADLRNAAKLAVKRYFTTQISYGFTSVDALSAVGWEPAQVE